MLYPIVVSLLKGAALFLDIWSWLIFIHSALTVFARPKDKESKIVKLLGRMTEPINAPFRRLLKRMGTYGMPLDLSPMLSLIALWALSRLLNQLAANLAGFLH
mgnify:CR=1 FL=1